MITELLKIYAGGTKLELVCVKSCKIHKKINQHGEISISAMIPTERKDEYLAAFTSEQYGQVRAADLSGNEKILFTGVVKSVEVEYDLYDATLKLVLAGGTLSLDMAQKTRTFQNAGTSYQALIGYVNEDLGAHMKMRSGLGKAADGIRVQYKETNWEFALRMASELNLSIIPDYTRAGIWYYIGVDESQSGKKLGYRTIQMKKDIGNFNTSKKQGLTQLQEEDSGFYEVTTREVMELGEAAIVEGKKLYIHEVNAEWQEETLINHYVLRTKNSFLQKKRENHKITGASLAGSITGVSKDRVAVSLSVDGSNPHHGSHYFPYSTVYSSASGTGWYCMPENGDSIRLYFPSAQEAKAYVLSSVHMDSSKTSKNQRSDPDTKSIRSIHDKEVLLAPDKLVLTNNAGMKVELNDADGITIESDKNITIKAKEDITLEGEKEMKMTAGELLELIQGNAHFKIKDNKVYLDGAKVKMQE